MFSKSYCPYCKAAKATIEEFIGDDENLDLTIVELDLIGGENASKIQSMLLKLTSKFCDWIKNRMNIYFYFLNKTFSGILFIRPAYSSKYFY